MATIFFSHASRDDALASGVETWLKAKGFDDIFIDHASIRSGDKWTEALRRATGSCRVVLCLVTPNWLSSAECFGEFMAGWYAGRRMIAIVCVAGVQLDSLQTERLARVYLEDQGVDISKVGAPAALDFDGHPEISGPLVEGLRAAGALAKVGLDPSVFSIDDRRDAEGRLLKPPFPGLESFGDTDADAAIFYGRSAEIAQVLEDLREFRAKGDRRAGADAARVYLIQGASGAGKSSLLKAGVLPRLRREKAWVALRSFRPGAEPLLNFAEALAKPIGGFSSSQAPGTIRTRLLRQWLTEKEKAKIAKTAISQNLSGEAQRAELASIDLTMLRALRSQLDAEIEPIKRGLDRLAATVLIAIDQGEELVRADDESADALAAYLRAALLHAPEGEPAQYAAVMTVRSDSFQELQMSPRLQRLGTRPFDLRPLPIYRFAEAIERPASRYGVEIEPLLVEVLMEDAGGRDGLPLLAFTLQRLWWQYEVEKRIQKAHYGVVGALPGLIEDAAERALRGIDPSAQQGPLSGKVSNERDKNGQRVFVPALAQINERGNTIRRVANLSNFDDVGREILTSFEKWRLVVTSGTNVEVAHEALFRVWPRFLRWLEPEKARLETLRGLESAAASWDANGRGDDFISHSGHRLRAAYALMQVADFRKQIESNSSALDYLKSAKRAEAGWRLANWYTLLFICLYVLVIVVPITLAYGVGNDDLAVLGLLGWTMRLAIGATGVGAAYLAALLRQMAARSGFQSDVAVGSLTIIANLAIGATFFLVYAERYKDIKSVADVIRNQLHSAVDGISDYALAGVTIIQDTFAFFALLPLVWAAFQLLWLVSVPIRILMGKFGRIRILPIGTY